MNKYKPGQEIQITLRGKLHRGRHCHLIFRADDDSDFPIAFQHPEGHFSWRALEKAEITILSEPEPTELGTIVSAGFKSEFRNLPPMLWILVPNSAKVSGKRWVSIDGIYLGTWENMTNPEIVHRGLPDQNQV